MTKLWHPYDGAFLKLVLLSLFLKIAFLGLFTSPLAVRIQEGQVAVFGTIQEDAFHRTIAAQMGQYLAELHGWVFLLATLPLVFGAVAPSLGSLLSLEETTWLRMIGLGSGPLATRVLLLAACFPAANALGDFIGLGVAITTGHPIDWEQPRAAILNSNTALLCSSTALLALNAAFTLRAKMRGLLATFCFAAPVLTGFLWWVLVRPQAAGFQLVTYFPIGCPFLAALATRPEHVWSSLALSGVFALCVLRFLRP